MLYILKRKGYADPSEVQATLVPDTSLSAQLDERLRWSPVEQFG